MQTGLLSDLIVVEYGHYISAPFCAKLLGDLGARVIKVEDPSGDVARTIGPFPGDAPHLEKSGLFLALNTSKRGVTLDVETDAGRERLLQLLDAADVFIENEPPGRLDALGLDYDVLRERNPNLIVTSLTPFGLSGPHRDFLATDLITFHMSGYAPSVLGGVDDPAREPPLRAGGHQAEFVTGLTAATATMMALALRAQTGTGTHVDVSAQEAMAMIAQSAVSNAALDQSPPSRRRGDVRTGALVAVLPTRDGYVGISPREEHQWAEWLKVMGDPEWGDDQRFANARLRQENWLALEPLLIEWTRRHGKEDIYRKAQNAHVPAFPVNTAADLFNSPQLGFRGFFRDVEHPIAGTLPYPGFPYALSNAKLEVRPAPTLGQHNDEVFSSEQKRASPEDSRLRRPRLRRPRLRRPRLKRLPRKESIDVLPLAGVRIVDFSWVIAGPTCTRILANMGAEVIKIESAKRPDPTRRGGGANFHFLNQSKRALSLNLRTARGLELAKALIAKSDVVIENFATGVFERLGLGYESLKALRSDIILVSSSGLGHTGPDKDHVAYGTLIQCFTGWSSLTGNPDGRPLPGGVWTDPVTGTLQAFLIASALHNRAQTGLGQYVDFAMAEAVCTMLPEALMDFAMNGRIQGPLGNADPMYAPHGLYPCRGEDRWVAIAVTNDAQWRSLCAAMERESMIDDPGFATVDGRRTHAEALDAVISEWTRPRDVDELVTRLQAAGVPAGPSMNGLDVYNDTHLEARGFFATHTSNKGERLRLPGLPWRFRPGPSPRVEPAPDLGEHNSAVLGEVLGLSPEEIQALVDDEVVH